LPLVLVTGVRRLDRIAPGAHPKDQVDVAQSVIERIDAC
jgi:hypothetical protein